MSSTDERRKGLRVTLPAQIYFNILDSAEEYMRGQASIVKRLAAIDSIKISEPKSESQMLLSRIDSKLSLILSIMAEQHNRKSYLNQATVYDVSEYGLSFGHNVEFAAGTPIEIGLSLPYTEGRLMDMAGTIVRCLPNENAKEKLPFAYGVEFTDILGSDQNEIIQWIFTRQREEIRRRRENK